MTQVQPTTNESVKNESTVLHQQHLAQTPIDHILQKLSRMEEGGQILQDAPTFA